MTWKAATLERDLSAGSSRVWEREGRPSLENNPAPHARACVCSHSWSARKRWELGGRGSPTTGERRTEP